MKRNRILFLLIVSLLLALAGTVSVAAGEEDEYEEEETEFIPEAYYDPIQTNEIPGWPQGEAVQSGSAVVMDLDTGTVLYSKNAEKKMYPASITKIMTAMIALERGNLDDVITFSELVYQIEEDSSHQGIQPGEKMTLRDALYGLMLESANDIGNGIAEYFGGGLDGFADLMNQKAEELGCVNTHFSNPHGLHSEDHYTCAYDMALIAKAAYAIPEFQKIVATTQYECPPTNVTDVSRYFVNHHRMLQKDSDYYKEWCIGGKTGYTSDAWNTLATYGEKNGLRLVCIVLRVPGLYRSYDETELLMNYGFDNFQKVETAPDMESPTFYEAMKLNYPGVASSQFQSDLLKKKIFRMIPGTAVIPNGAKREDMDGVSESIEPDPASSEVFSAGRRISYSYHGWPVGTGEVYLYPMSTDITLPFEQSRDMEKLLREASSRKIREEIQKTADDVVYKIESIYLSARDYAENHQLTVALAGSLILVVLIVIIIILVMRCTRETRIQRRRRQEERELLRREEEIDRMTTAQIEQELRAAMEQEQQRQKQEAARREEERLQEEKLRETEKILEEINQKTSSDK